MQAACEGHSRIETGVFCYDFHTPNYILGTVWRGVYLACYTGHFSLNDPTIHKGSWIFIFIYGTAVIGMAWACPCVETVRRIIWRHSCMYWTDKPLRQLRQNLLDDKIHNFMYLMQYDSERLPFRIPTSVILIKGHAWK